MLHYDGATWTEALVGTSEDLISLWGTSPDQIVLVGGRNNGQVVRWDGRTWTHRSLAPLPGLNGVWTRGGVAHVVGVGGTIATVDLETFAVTDETPPDVAPSLDFHAVFGDAQGRLTAVGGNFLQVMGPYRGVAYTRGRSDED